MHRRTIGVDLAIGATQVAQIYEDGRPVGGPIRFLLNAVDPARLVEEATRDLTEHTHVQAVMEQTGTAWFPVASWLQTGH